MGATSCCWGLAAGVVQRSDLTLRANRRTGRTLVISEGVPSAPRIFSACSPGRVQPASLAPSMPQPFSGLRLAPARNTSELRPRHALRAATPHRKCLLIHDFFVIAELTTPSVLEPLADSRRQGKVPGYGHDSGMALHPTGRAAPDSGQVDAWREMQSSARTRNMNSAGQVTR
jgi:hypothetical protein